MARTRTLHPVVRARALHYAATQKHRHAKPLVYAGLFVLRRIATVVCLATAAIPALGQTAAPAAVPCLECQAFSALPEQIEPLPQQLQGTRVLVRVSAATPADVIPQAIGEIRRRGGQAGVHLTEIPGEDSPAVSAGGDSLVVDVPAGDADRQAFALKQALTRAP